MCLTANYQGCAEREAHTAGSRFSVATHFRPVNRRVITLQRPKIYIDAAENIALR